MDNFKDINNVIEVLDSKEFKKKFKKTDSLPLLPVATKTIEFLQNDDDKGLESLKMLTTILRTYNVPVEAYFKFIKNTAEISFIDKEYKDLLISEYRDLFRFLDSTKFTDLQKVELHMKLIESIENSKDRSEKRELMGKIVMVVSGGAVVATSSIVLGKFGIKYLDHKEKIAKIMANRDNIKAFCDLGMKVLDIPLKILSK